MDHLPYPQDATLPPVSIPYYSKFEFDDGSFTDFPARCGFDKSNFVYGDFGSIPWDDHTAFLQAWLFFGLIHECLGAPTDDFIDRSTNKITTERLPQWGHKWRKGLPYFSRSKRQIEYERVSKCLRETCALLTTLDDARPGNPKRSSLSEEVAFSIAVLGITIEQIITDFDLQSSTGDAEDAYRQTSQAGVWPTTQYARKRLEAAGWCKSESLRLERYVRFQLPRCGLLYLTGVHRSKRQASTTVDQCNLSDRQRITRGVPTAAAWQRTLWRRRTSLLTLKDVPIKGTAATVRTLAPWSQMSLRS